MTTILTGTPLEFTNNETGDQLTTSRVILDEDQPPYAIAVRYQPAMQSWLCSVASSGTAGTRFVTDRPLRAKGDVLANIVTEGRPRGALVMVTRDGLDPTRETWTEGGRLVYFPQGIESVTDIPEEESAA